MYSDAQQNIRCIQNLQRIGRIKSKLPPNPLPGFLAEPSENWYTNETAEVWDLCLHALHIVGFMGTSKLTEERRMEISTFFGSLCQHVVWIMECRIKRAPYDDIQAKTSLLKEYYDWRAKVIDAFHRFAEDCDYTKASKVFLGLSGEQEKLYAMWELLMVCKFNVVAKIEIPEADVPSEEKLHTPATENILGFLSVADLAKHHSVDAEVLRKRLDRHREKHALDTDLFIESQDRGKNKPKYLYSAEKVLPIIKELKKKASIKRPSQRK